jgi:hypothetical protein
MKVSVSLLRRLQPGDHPLGLPKLDGQFANKLLGFFDCSLIVGAVEIDTKPDAAVRPYLISAIVRHVPQLQRSPAKLGPLRSIVKRKRGGEALQNVRNCTRCTAPAAAKSPVANRGMRRGQVNFRVAATAYADLEGAQDSNLNQRCAGLPCLRRFTRPLRKGLAAP